MAQLISEDAIAFGATDSIVSNGFDSYKSEDFKLLRQYFYAVLLHGTKTGVYVNGLYDPFEFAPLLVNAHKKYGKGRAILLISCMVGWTFARPLARKTQLPIVAGLSFVSFGGDFTGTKLHRYLTTLDANGIQLQDSATGQNNSNVKFRPEWIFYHPNGNTEVLPGGKFLNQDEAVKHAKLYVKN
ncbi:MAG TPA: hypothetical protein PKY59_04145 [Pyrinomonadaceae bacterium]|nr:hypothetical protein [Pyrinomonadaceae bacterium]